MGCRGYGILMARLECVIIIPSPVALTRDDPHHAFLSCSEGCGHSCPSYCRGYVAFPRRPFDGWLKLKKHISLYPTQATLPLALSHPRRGKLACSADPFSRRQGPDRGHQPARHPYGDEHMLVRSTQAHEMSFAGPTSQFDAVVCWAPHVLALQPTCR